MQTIRVGSEGSCYVSDLLRYSIQMVEEHYDKGCQADLGGTTTTARVEGEGGDDGVGGQSALTSAASLKKTPDKRRNHLRYLELTSAARSCPYWVAWGTTKKVQCLVSCVEADRKPHAKQVLQPCRSSRHGMVQRSSELQPRVEGSLRALDTVSLPPKLWETS